MGYEVCAMRRPIARVGENASSLPSAFSSIGLKYGHPPLHQHREGLHLRWRRCGDVQTELKMRLLDGIGCLHQGFITGPWGPFLYPQM